MSQFFKIYTYTYWDNRETTQLSEVRLLSLKNVFEKYPVIEKDFFDLRRQFCSIKVRPPDSLGRRQIETKEDMRARQVKSPDLADVLVYGEYGYFIGNMSDIKAYSYR